MAQDASPSSIQPPDKGLPGAGTALALLLAINLFNYIDRQVLMAVEPSIRQEFFPDNYDTESARFQTGLLATAFLVTYMLISPIFGYLGDRYSRWWLIAFGITVWTLASGGSGLATTFGMMFLMRCLVGFGEAAYGPTAPSLISDLYPVKMRGRKLALFYVAIPVGSALGYTLGGTVESMTGDWRWAFYVVVPPGLILAALCVMMREPPRGLADDAKKAKPPVLRWKDYRVLAKTPSYVLCTAGMTAMTFALGGISFWMRDYLDYKQIDKVFGTIGSTTFFGALTAISGLIATILGGYLGDKLRDRFPGSYFLVSGTAMLIAAPLLVLFVFTPFPLAWVVLFIAVFCLFFNTGPTNTVLANVTHPSIRSSAFALNILIIHLLGDAISPPILGWIIGPDRYAAAFIITASMVGLGGIFWLYGIKHLQHDTEQAPLRTPGE